MPIRTAVVLLAALLLSACQPGAHAAGTPRRALAPEVPEAPQPWPTSLVMAIGEEVRLGGGRLKLERIAADSRCPKDAQCVWAGEVTLAFTYAAGGTAVPRAFQLSERGQPRYSLGEHDILLTGFGPCPAAHTPASPAGCATVAFEASQLR